jgi:hypothetical protein
MVHDASLMHPTLAVSDLYSLAVVGVAQGVGNNVTYVVHQTVIFNLI